MIFSFSGCGSRLRGSYCRIIGNARSCIFNYFFGGLFRHGRVCERHTGAGITAAEIIAQHLPIDPPRDLLPESIEEKVICYADKFFSKSRPDEPPKTLERARKSLAKFGGDTLARFDALVALFGVPEDLNV